MNKISYFFFTGLIFLSCNRIKNKTEELGNRLSEKAKKEVSKRSEKILDKVFPKFDYDKSDTDNNKKRFKDFIKVEISDDVKNIYCFDDAVGIDADYMFSFNCNEKTSNKIIEVHQLTIDSTNSDNAFGLQHDFEWWDKQRIKELQKYSWSKNERYFKYYWYDKVNSKAYFFDFDL